MFQEKESIDGGVEMMECVCVRACKITCLMKLGQLMFDTDELVPGSFH